MPTEIPAFKCNVCGKVFVGKDPGDRDKPFQEAHLCEVQTGTVFKFNEGFKFWGHTRGNDAQLFSITERRITPSKQTNQHPVPIYKVSCLTNLGVQEQYMSEAEIIMQLEREK